MHALDSKRGARDGEGEDEGGGRADARHQVTASCASRVVSVAIETLKRGGKDMRAPHGALTPASGSHAMRPVRILALHGFRTCARTLDAQARLAGWQATYGDLATFTFVNAPMVSSSGMPEEVRAFFGEEMEAREWVNARRTALGTTTYEGLEASLRTIENACEAEGPFDGILGFSQGGTVAAIAMATPALGTRFSFGIFVSGMKSRAEETAALDFGSVRAPTLHIVGKNDRIVPNAVSEELFNAMSSSERTRETHAGGHVVPKVNETGEPILRAFLEARHREANAR